MCFFSGDLVHQTDESFLFSNRGHHDRECIETPLIDRKYACSAGLSQFEFIPCKPSLEEGRYILGLKYIDETHSQNVIVINEAVGAIKYGYLANELPRIPCIEQKVTRLQPILEDLNFRRSGPLDPFKIKLSVHSDCVHPEIGYRRSFVEFACRPHKPNLLRRYKFCKGDYGIINPGSISHLTEHLDKDRSREIIKQLQGVRMLTAKTIRLI